MVDWNNKKCFKSARGSVALKKNTWGILWNIPPGTQNLHHIELNCQYYRRWNAILYIQLLKSYEIVIIPCGQRGSIQLDWNKLCSIQLDISYDPIPVFIMPLQIWFTHNCVLNGLGYGIGHRFKSFVIIESIVWGRTCIRKSFYPGSVRE